MSCSDLEQALKALCPDTKHMGSPQGKTKCIIWAEYGLNQVHGDDRTQLRIPKVQIDAYCQEPDPLAEDGFFVSILDTLDGLGVPYDVQDIGYDPDTALMRCIIHCDVL